MAARAGGAGSRERAAHPAAVGAELRRRCSAGAAVERVPRRRRRASVVDLCHTARCGDRTTSTGWRWSAHARSELTSPASGLACADDRAGSASGRRAATAGRGSAFVFSGQGPQWYAMGRELLAEEPVFRDVVVECDALLRPLSDWSLLERAQPAGGARRGSTKPRSRSRRCSPCRSALARLVEIVGRRRRRRRRPQRRRDRRAARRRRARAREAVRVVWHRGRDHAAGDRARPHGFRRAHRGGGRANS